MASFSLVISIIFGVIILALGIYLLYTAQYRRFEQPSDDTIYYNFFMSQYTQGHAELLGKPIKGTDRIGIEYVPKDVNWLRHWKKGGYSNIDFKPRIFWVHQEKIINLNKGESSNERNMAIILPFTSSDVSSRMQKNIFGQLMAGMASETNKIMASSTFYNNEIEKFNELINSPHVGIAEKEIFDRIKEIADEANKTLSRDKDSRKTTYENIGERRPY